MNGLLTLTFDDSLSYPPEAYQSLTGLKRRSVPLRPKDKELIDFAELTIVPGAWSDPELC